MLTAVNDFRRVFNLQNLSCLSTAAEVPDPTSCHGARQNRGLHNSVWKFFTVAKLSKVRSGFLCSWPLGGGATCGLLLCTLQSGFGPVSCDDAKKDQGRLEREHLRKVGKVTTGHPAAASS